MITINNILKQLLQLHFNLDSRIIKPFTPYTLLDIFDSLDKYLAA